MINDRPLISFYVIAYNQEKFIAEAVAGALAQTWSPLEIVLSDDCSDDATFEIMKTMADEYKGPHSIVLNRNEINLGVGAHINRIIQLCKGELIVASAGDDVSVPERTQKLYNHWIAQKGEPDLVFSNIIETKEDGTTLCEREFQKEIPGGGSRGEFIWTYQKRISQMAPPVHGAAVAYPKRTFYDFGPLWDKIIFEDGILSWRAELRGGTTLCQEYLVRHRNHSGQMTNLYSKQALMEANIRRRKLMWSKLQSAKQNLSDTKFALEKGLIIKDVYRASENFLNERIHRKDLEYRLHWDFILKRLAILLKNRHVFYKKSRLTELFFIVTPRPLYIMLLRVYLKFRIS